MRQYLFAAGIILLLNACNNAEPSPKKPVPPNFTIEEKISFIPVTSFLKGQIYDIKQKGLKPIEFTTINDHTDSAFVKFEDLEELVKEFLHPEIDSANMIPFFTELKFLDQTIASYTFTYDPKPNIPDSIPFKHWDVYIDPTTNKITRVYLLKKSSNNKTLQLTWQSNQFCKITTIIEEPGGSAKVEKEQKISWDY